MSVSAVRDHYLTFAIFPTLLFSHCTVSTTLRSCDNDLLLVMMLYLVSCSMGSVKSLLEEKIPGVYVLSLMIGKRLHVLSCAVLHCPVPYCTVLYCTVLWFVLHRNVLYCAVLCCGVLWCAVLRSRCAVTIMNQVVVYAPAERAETIPHWPLPAVRD
jgi:hypothetical protein